MLNLIVTEFMKLRRAKVLWLIPLAAALTVFLGVMPQYDAKDIVEWRSSLNGTVFLAALVSAPALFTILTGFIFAREYQDKTINSLFAYPYSRVQVLIAKFVVLSILPIISMLVTYILYLGFSLVLRHEAMPHGFILANLQRFLYLGLLQCVFIPLYTAVTIVSKNYIPPIAVGIGAVFCNLVVLNSKYNMLFPFTIPAMLTTPNALKDAVYGVSAAATSLVITLLLGTVFSVLYYAKSDVQ